MTTLTHQERAERAAKVINVPALVAFSAWPAQGQEPETTNIMTSPKEAHHE